MSGTAPTLALEGVTVLDFSTLLPGPLAGLMLAEAGATVIKIERPGSGDEMRSYRPKFCDTSANFALLNRGKRSIAIDLKASGAVDRLAPLLARVDVLIEQFRPGVMARLGLGYAQLSARYPRLVYCSITGFGQEGARARVASHDLNYLALTGLLALSCGRDGAPVLPPTPIADIAGGSYPALVNILLALIARDRSGVGRHLDISMADSLYTLAYWALAQGFATGAWPQPGAEQVTGGSPRYRVYETADGRYLAAAPLEDRFWARFCELIELPSPLRDDHASPGATGAAVANCIARRSAAEWDARFAGEDVCCCAVRSLEDAVKELQLQGRRLFERQVRVSGRTIPALPLPLTEGLRRSTPVADAPVLGEMDGLFG